MVLMLNKAIDHVVRPHLEAGKNTGSSRRATKLIPGLRHHRTTKGMWFNNAR